MKYVVCLPFIHRPYALACIDTWKFTQESGAIPVVIDNTIDNIGIMASHNRGRGIALEQDCEWLIVMSAAIRFGEPGGIDFIQALRDRPNHDVVEAAGVFGWHLIAFSNDILRRVGEWDENFTPYGFDDIDMSLRIQKATTRGGRELQLWDKAIIDVSDMGMGHSIELGGVRADVHQQIDYFTRKWGRHPGGWDQPTFDNPFNNLWNPLSYWPPRSPT